MKLKPVGLTFVFFASVLSGFASTTLPGLVVRSQLAGTPRWNVLCVLSVKQPLCAEALSVKFCVARAAVRDGDRRGRAPDRSRAWLAVIDRIGARRGR